MATQHGDGTEPDDGLRQVLRQMARDTDEDPPARGLDALLAAAAARRPTPRPSAWARARAYVASALAQPAVMAAAGLVVVAAVGGVIYTRGGARVAEPTTGSAAVGGAVATSEEARTRTLDEGAPAGALAGAAPAPVVPAVETAVAPTDPAPEASATKRRAPQQAPARPARGQLDDAFAGDGAGPSGYGRSGTGDETKLARGGQAGAAAGARAVTSNDKAKLDEPSAPPPPPPPPPSEQENDRAERAEAPPTVAAQIKAARAAAARGDCATARRLAAEVERRDRAMYTRELAKDATLARCAP
ncbi:MAG: hypothetical protein R2939_22570 [Kofleriaceae bacterium]